MNGEPFFSVIVPAHNSAEYLERGLQSIRSQTFTDYELIVVCDACTDNTAEVARRYTDHVIGTGYGLDGMARNTGLDMARGQNILFMDDDDWFLHEYCFHQIAGKMSVSDADIMLYSFIWKGRGYTHQMMQRYIAVWNKCWRRDFIGDTRFPAKPYWSDVEFDKAMFAKNPNVFRWDMPMYYYNYLREGSISWRQAKGEIE